MVNKNIFVRTVGKKQAELEKLQLTDTNVEDYVCTLASFSLHSSDNHAQSYLGLIFSSVFGISLIHLAHKQGRKL